MSAVVVELDSSLNKSRYTVPTLVLDLFSSLSNSTTRMQAFNSRLESFAKARRVKQSTTKRTLTLKWPHPLHFVATPDTLTEAGFFFNPAWDAPDNVECFLCGKSLDGWEEQDDPFTIHWDKCRDSCAWAIVRCGLSEDLDRKGKYVACPSIRIVLAQVGLFSYSFVFKDPSRQPDGKAMEKARLATFKLNDSWPHDRVKGHGANSSKACRVLSLLISVS
jgi:baculoviral IAP repeat-containing protein 5